MGKAGRIAAGAAIALAMVMLGACGMSGAYFVKAAYEDHQLLNKIREADQRQLIDAAARVQQYQQQQTQQTAPKPPAQ